MKILSGIIISLASSTIFFASVGKASTVICHTSKNGGNFSILVGQLTQEGFTGTLSRGINQTRAGAVHAQFEIAGTPVSAPTNNTISFDVPTKIVMPAPYEDIEWQKVNMTFQKSLLVRGRGGLIEKGIINSETGATSYESQYICVVRQL